MEYSAKKTIEKSGKVGIIVGLGVLVEYWAVSSIPFLTSLPQGTISTAVSTGIYGVVNWLKNRKK
jgi:hypothetical protein